MHASPDLLALLALGERLGTPEEHAHISGCSECRAELQSLRAAADAGRRTSEGDVLASPPPHVWQRIQQELQLSDAGPGRSGADTTLADAPAPPRGEAPAPLTGVPSPPDQRGVRAASLVLAAALALVVGIGLGSNLDRLSPRGTQVTSVQLNALPPFSGSSGKASVERDRDGKRVLVVQIDTPVPATGPREVWLANSSADRMLPMGYLTGNTGRFPIPPEMEMSATPLVDISQEPADDKDPSHSGHSMLRGKLPL